MPWFRLRAVDPATDCFTHEAYFEFDEVGQLADILGTKELKVGDCFELSGLEYASIVQRFKLDLPQTAQTAELWQLDDNFDRRPTHTGRELLLMLEGRKPFAAFVDTVPTTKPDVIPEKFFDPYVEQGRFAKREAYEDLVSRDKGSVKLRRVMYAMPGQEWRFDALLSLWKLAASHGWNDGFEKLEGFLYGYEIEIDPFFEK